MELWTYCSYDVEQPACDLFAECLLEEAPHLVPLSTFSNSLRLSSITLQCLKHLQVKAAKFLGPIFQVAKQPPLVGTLHPLSKVV